MKPVMILAGGTGGHVFPALAVANELRDRGVPIIWVGTNKGIESKVVPAAGFLMETMSVQGLRGKGLIQYLRAPIIILRAMYESFHIILRHKPCVLLGMGGFVSGPCALVGVLLRKPLIIHEQNAIIGFTNRILSPLSRTMFTGFPIKCKRYKSEYCGNPVRRKLMEIPIPEKRFINRKSCKRLLVIGGSQGSSSLNKFVPQVVQSLSKSIDIEVWHQTGVNKSEGVLDFYRSNKLDARVVEFIDEIEHAYAWADLIVCRSGAITLSEISAVGLGSLLVPYPYAVGNHQTANARSYVEAGAAYLMLESDLSSGKLSELLLSIFSDPRRVLRMACAAKSLSQKYASERVADACMKACDYQSRGTK